MDKNNKIFIAASLANGAFFNDFTFAGTSGSPIKAVKTARRCHGIGWGLTDGDCGNLYF